MGGLQGKSMPRSDFAVLHSIRVRFNEVDRQGIVHNSIPLVYFGVAMNEYFRGLDYDRFAGDEANGTGMHAVQATVTYKTPMRFDEQIEVGVRASCLGRTSLRFSYEIFRTGDNAAAVSGKQVWVNTSSTSHRPVPWPEDMREALRRRESGRLLET